MQDFRMETFLAVCRLGSYTRAAEELMALTTADLQEEDAPQTEEINP